MSNNPESNESEYKYDGNADNFHASLATIEPESEEETIDEAPEAKEPEQVVEPDGEEPEEEEEEEDEPEGEALPKELLQRIMDDPALQKVLKNRTIRETKEELKLEREQTRTERDARIIAEREAASYKAAMDEYFKGKQPDPDAGESEWIDPEAEKAFKKLDARLAKNDEAEAIKTAIKALHVEAGNHIGEFVTKNSISDYPDAINYALNVKARELTAMGVPEKELRNRVDQWADLIAYTAIQNGKNIAEYGYSLAKDMGYQTKAKPTQATKKTGVNLDAIRENAKKTAPERPGSDVGLGDGDYKTLPKNKHGEVDPKEFAKILAKYQ